MIIMDMSTENRLRQQALSLVKRHFEWFNEGNLAEARRQLFHPSGIQERPLDIYVRTMGQLRPFHVVSTSVRRVEDVRETRHGRVATIWVDAEVLCKLGQRAADISVWWFPDADHLEISGRPSHWVLEQIHGQKGGMDRVLDSGSVAPIPPLGGLAPSEGRTPSGQGGEAVPNKWEKNPTF